MVPFTKNIIIIVPLPNFVLYKTVLQVYVGSIELLVIVIKTEGLLTPRKNCYKTPRWKLQFSPKKTSGTSLQTKTS